MNESQPSPYTSPETFDWNKFKDETSNKALQDILVILGGAAETICYTGEKSPKEVNQIYNPIANMLRDAMVRHNVGYHQAGEIFDYLRAIISTMESKLKKEYEGHQQEILSRYTGGKNPATGKFDVSFATFSQLANAVEKSRGATGGNVFDYFTEKNEVPPSNPDEMK